ESLYEPIEYEELTEEQQAAVDSLNLSQLLQQELDEPEPDLAVVRFVIRRFAQLKDDGIVDTLLGNLDQLHPAFPDIIKYLGVLTELDDEQRVDIGERVLSLLDA